MALSGKKRQGGWVEGEDAVGSQDALGRKRLCTRLSMDDFLSFDGPTGTALAPHGTRPDFFGHLGLSERNPRHMIIYRKMKQEATTGMERLFSTRKSLQPGFAHDESVQAPYSLQQITERAFQREVENIYEFASPRTRGIYDIMRTGEGRNWVIGWMLARVIQAAHDRMARATSSGADTDSSMLTICSTVADCPSVRTDDTTPKYWPRTIPSPDFSDTEEWDTSEGQQNMARDEPISKRPRLPATPSKFWIHVMDDA